MEKQKRQPFGWRFLYKRKGVMKKFLLTCQ